MSLLANVVMIAIRNKILILCNNMGRPFYSHEEMSRALELHVLGLGVTEIREKVSKGQASPSLRTIGYWIKRFRTLSSRELNLDQTIEWHLLDTYGLPWEASGLIRRLSRRGLPSKRRASWWWRLTIAKPELSDDELLDMAETCVVYQHMSLLGTGVPDWSKVWDQIRKDGNGKYESAVEYHCLPEKYALCEFPSEVALPDWIGGSGFISITQSQGRVSVICEEDPIPNDGDDIEGIKIVRGWYCIRSDSDKWPHIGGTKNLVVSTGNSVYILVQARDREHVREILSNAKITFVS